MATKVQPKRLVAPQHKSRVTMNPSKRDSTSSLKDFLDWIEEAGKQIPEKDLARIPTDLAKNHEHYLYGSPKQNL